MFQIVEKSQLEKNNFCKTPRNKMIKFSLKIIRTASIKFLVIEKNRNPVKATSSVVSWT